MEEIFINLLEQSAVVAILGLGIWDYRKKLGKKEDEIAKERESHKKEIRELNEKHAAELKELNAFVREHEKEHLTALDNLTDAIEGLYK